jgi:hypothetical protein
MYKKMKSLFMLACCLSWAVLSLAQVKRVEPSCITFSYNDLLAIRKSIKAGDTVYKASYNSLLRKATTLLKKKPDTVTDGDLPPGGDVHDYFSIGKFSWRNPNTPNGMPYIIGDGKYNQEAFGDRYDLTRFQNTVSSVNALALAWFYTGDETYALKAGQLLKTWFIDPATRMNPNMNFAAALPGVYDGLPTGIIFTVMLIEMTDHIQLLRLSGSWEQAADDALNKWFVDYKHWLETSNFGKREKAGSNNHGTWYSAQLVAYSLLTGSKEGIAEQFELAKDKLSSQVTPDGQLPLEMKRVEGFHYFIYGLKAFNVLANGLEKFGYHLWEYKTPDSKSLALPYQFIIPFITGEKPWTTGGVVEVNAADEMLMLKQAAAKYDLPGSHQAIEMLNAKMKPNDIDRLYIYR